MGRRDGDGVPGPDDLAQPGGHDRSPAHRARALPPRHGQEGERRGRRSRCSGRCTSPKPRSVSTTTRTRCRAACASASASPSPSACGPRMLFADEPTTALDVTVQHQILNLLAEQQQRSCDGDDPRDPRPRRGRRAHRRDHGDVRRQGRREGADVEAVQRAAPPLHPGPAVVDPEGHPAQAHPAERHSRSAAEPDRTAARLQVRPPLRLRAGHLPHRGARVAFDRCRRPRVRLPLPGGHARGRGGLPGEHRQRSSRRRSPPPASSGRAKRWSADGRLGHRPSPARRRGAAPGHRPGRRVPRRQGPHRQGGQRHQLRHRTGRDARARRRVGMRQVDHRPGPAAVAEADERLGRARRRRPRQPRRQDDAPAPHAAADDLPGSDLVAESPPHDRRGRRRTAQRVGAEEQGRTVEDRRSHPRSGRRRSRAGAATSGRTSSPAASASASRSPGRS